MTEQEKTAAMIHKGPFEETEGLTVLVPQPHERLVQHCEEGEPPLDGIHEHLFAAFGELVEHESE